MTRRSDVDGMAARYARSARVLGLIPESTPVHVTAGSRTYGNAWRVYLSGQPGSNLPGLGPLGQTAAECYARLHAACVALEAVSDTLAADDEPWRHCPRCEQYRGPRSFRWQPTKGRRHARCRECERTYSRDSNARRRQEQPA